MREASSQKFFAKIPRNDGDPSGSDNGQFLLEVPSFLKQRFSVEFYDWVPSLLPDAYVVNFYFQDNPIFWNIDVQCLATPHIPSLTTVTLDPADHFLKLWVLNAKDYLRGNQKADIAKLAQRILKEKDLHMKTNRDLMKEMLKAIKGMATPSRYLFLAKCEDICQEMERIA